MSVAAADALRASGIERAGTHGEAQCWDCGRQGSGVEPQSVLSSGSPAGRTYTPLSNAIDSPGADADLWIVGLTIAGLDTIHGAVNTITTVVCVRARRHLGAHVFDPANGGSSSGSACSGSSATRGLLGAPPFFGIVSGDLPGVQPFFAFTTFLIAVPTGVKFFNWIGTMWRDS